MNSQRASNNAKGSTRKLKSPSHSKSKSITRQKKTLIQPNVVSKRNTTTTTTTPVAYKPPSLEQIGHSKFVGSLRVVLLGPPGAGKGSFAKYIASYYQIPTISTGDILRAEVKKRSPLGRRVEEITARGDLVDDILIMEMLSKRLEEPDTSNGYILDGFPRTLPQAKALNDFAHKDTTPFHPPNVVLNINLREDVNIAKALGRRVCSDCTRGYNVANIVEDVMYMPAILPTTGAKNLLLLEKNNDIKNSTTTTNTAATDQTDPEYYCDDPCGGKLLTRVDDTLATIQNRLNIYHTNTAPLVEYYGEQGILTTWNVVRGLEDTGALLQMLDNHLLDLGYIPNANL